MRYATRLEVSRAAAETMAPGELEVLLERVLVGVFAGERLRMAERAAEVARLAAGMLLGRHCATCVKTSGPPVAPMAVVADASKGEKP